MQLTSESLQHLKSSIIQLSLLQQEGNEIHIEQQIVALKEQLESTLSMDDALSGVKVEESRVWPSIRLFMRYLWYLHVRHTLMALMDSDDNYDMDYSLMLVTWALRLLPFCTHQLVMSDNYQMTYIPRLSSRTWLSLLSVKH